MSNVFSNVAKSLFKRRVRCCCRRNCSNSLKSKASCVVINNERCFDNYQVTDGVLLKKVKEKESLTFETIFCILACDTVENLQKEKKALTTPCFFHYEMLSNIINIKWQSLKTFHRGK